MDLEVGGLFCCMGVCVSIIDILGEASEMETVRETLKKSLHPLSDGYFIEQVDMDRDTDYWLGKDGSVERTYLADRWDDAVQKAEGMIGHMEERL